MKRTTVCLFLLILAACSSTVPSTSISKDGQFPPPSSVYMKYLGPAKVENDSDPINACRVYVFRIEDYYQTAVWCPTGKVVASSSGHQKHSDDDAAATTIATTSGQ